MIRPERRRAWVAVFAAVLIWSAWKPTDYTIWILEVFYRCPFRQKLWIGYNVKK